MMTLGVLALAWVQGGPGPGLSVETGFTGRSFQSNWNRCLIQIENDAESREMELAVTIRGRFQSPVFRQALTLGPRARKRFEFPLFLSGLELQAEAELLDRRGGKLARADAPFRFFEERERQVLVVGIPPRWIQEATLAIPTAVAPLAPDRFPVSAVPLRAVDAIVFVEPVRLDEVQAAALRAWVDAGGRLIFSSGRGTVPVSRSLWRELCPLEGEETREVLLPSPGGSFSAPLTGGTLRPGVESRALVPGHPSLYFETRGRGRIVFSAFPLDLAGIERISPPEPLWRSILELPPRKPEAPEASLETRSGPARFLETEILARALLADHGDRVRLGVLALGTPILLLYVAWIGPVDFLRLRRRGRLGRGWIPFVGATGICTLASLAWGALVTPGAATLDAHLFADPEGMESISVLRAATSGAVTLTGTEAIWPLGVLGKFGTPEDDPPVLRPTATVDLSLPASAPRAFISVRGPGQALGLAMECRWTRDRRGLELSNPGDIPIRELRLVTSSGITPLGALSPGERRRLERLSLREIPWSEWMRTPVRSWQEGWWEDDSSRAIFGDGDPLLTISFYEQITRNRSAGSVYRLGQRGLDWTGALDRGRTVFVGTFDRDVTGITVAPAARPRIQGLFRTLVEEGP